MKCATEYNEYVRRSKRIEFITLCLYVDDLLITCNCKKEIEDFKLDPLKEFEMADIGNISYFTGIELYKCCRGLMMYQRRHASEILKRFETKHYNYASTPADLRLQLTKDSVEGTLIQQNIEGLLDH